MTDYGGGDHLNGRQAAYSWLVIGQPVGAGLAYAYRPYTSSVCDLNSTSALQLRYAA